MNQDFPPPIAADIARARRLAWWTIGWMASIILVMWAAMGSSQAMRTALFEDILSLVPAIVLLVALRFEQRAPTRLFRHGFGRVHSLAFLISAVALIAMGAFLLLESAMTLLAAEHVTIAPVTLFGTDIWLGWLMLGALLYSVVPPLLLGRLKLPIAERLHDEVLHTDALMQKADWMTGLAGAAGVIGLGFGLWWADAAAAMIISFSILLDGITAIRIATAELVDGVPRALGKDEMAEDARRLHDRLAREYPNADIRLRESGRYILAQIHGVTPTEPVNPGALWPGPPERRWRLAGISFVPRSA